MFAVGVTASLLGPLDYMFGETLRVAVTVAVAIALLMAVAARVNDWGFEKAVKNWLFVTSLVAIVLFTQHSPYEGSGRTLDLVPSLAERLNQRVCVDLRTTDAISVVAEVQDAHGGRISRVTRMTARRA